MKHFHKDKKRAYGQGHSVARYICKHIFEYISKLLWGTHNFFLLIDGTFDALHSVRKKFFDIFNSLRFIGLGNGVARYTILEVSFEFHVHSRQSRRFWKAISLISFTKPKLKDHKKDWNSAQNRFLSFWCYFSFENAVSHVTRKSVAR